jgi:hypothetical protein
VREREDANRTREAGHLDEIQGVVANALDAFRNGAVGFIDWLDLAVPNEALHGRVANAGKFPKLGTENQTDQKSHRYPAEV